MVTSLRDQGVTTVRALVHPEHEASQNVARAVGMTETETETVVDGRVRWLARLSPPGGGGRR